MSQVKYCNKCVLTSNDYPNIQIDNNGVCNICHSYEEVYKREVLSGPCGQKKLNEVLSEAKARMSKKKYDCIIGVSGGIDSTYLAYMAKQWGLRVLAVHIDGGWNSETSVSNIDNLLKKTGFDLYTHVINWEQMRNVQKAFIHANVLDIDLPFDNAYIAALYQSARKFRVKYIFTGHNTVTEGYLPPNFTHYKLDSLNIQSIFKKYGEGSLRGFPMIGPLRAYFYEHILGIRFFSPLNWIDYNKSNIKEIVEKEMAWRDYGGKHCENVYTRFYQRFILLKKFMLDKRKSHLQTLICSGKISREEAIETLQSTSPYDNPEMCESDKNFFIAKMQMTKEEFEDYMNSPQVQHTQYGSIINIYSRIRPIYRFLKGKL